MSDPTFELSITSAGLARHFNAFVPDGQGGRLAEHTFECARRFGRPGAGAGCRIGRLISNLTYALLAHLLERVGQDGGPLRLTLAVN